MPHLTRPIGPLPPERTYQITSPRFSVQIVVRERHVLRTAPILKYMRRWELTTVRAYAHKHGWRVEEVVGG